MQDVFQVITSFNVDIDVYFQFGCTIEGELTTAGRLTINLMDRLLGS